jgi:hypothetical protein
MIGTLRAFAWMRWRILINSFERTGARDRLERFSIAIEQLGPIVAALLMIPAALSLAAIGAAGGYILAHDNPRPVLLEAARFLLLAATGFSVVGPLLLPAGDRTNPIRLLLLPIPRHTLYAAQGAATLSDPWVLLALPLLAFIPLGLAAGGAPATAVISLVAGLLLLATIIGISTLVTSVLHLVVRDRRRGELLGLAFILIVPLIGMLPGLIESELSRHETTSTARAERAPAWLRDGGRAAFAMAPSELYLKATGVQFGDGRTPPAGPLAGLAAAAIALHAAGLFVFGRLLDSPGTTTARRTRGTAAVWGRTLPMLSPGASAVALTQLRLAMRTPRGRAILLSPLFVFIMLGVMARRIEGTNFGFTTMQGGLGLATFGCFVSLLSTLPILMNQFAVDRAGLTLTLLSPLSDRELLRGKAVGNGLIAWAPTLVCFTGALLIFDGGSPALWVSIPLGLMATYLIVAPVAAMFSALFPRTVDMNSIGRSSNAHGMATLLGMAALVAAAVPSLLVIVLASAVLHRPTLSPLLLLVWCAIAAVLCRVLFVPAEHVFARRRENLALIA